MAARRAAAAAVARLLLLPALLLHWTYTCHVLPIAGGFHGIGLYLLVCSNAVHNRTLVIGSTLAALRTGLRAGQCLSVLKL